MKTLVVVHPKNLPDAALCAIDQFVLRGGKLIACVDPFSVKEMISPPAAEPDDDAGGRRRLPSTLGALFDAWG